MVLSVLESRDNIRCALVDHTLDWLAVEHNSFNRPVDRELREFPSSESSLTLTKLEGVVVDLELWVVRKFWPDTSIDWGAVEFGEHFSLLFGLQEPFHIANC